ncbi:alpha/beta hydrolase [Neptuniibacter sp. SY11_33]|uniref:alpha/beta hydrolase n=1 Tax=Neptuniibacter sp. SY11_33 TaxID=3398215 RepID=UPI0039F4581B
MKGFSQRNVFLGILSCLLSFAVYGEGFRGQITSRGYTQYSDVKYGAHRSQAFDVYTRDDISNAPVIFMVHGGAWSKGDKSAESVVLNKVQRWVAAGFVFVSVNYRLVPEVTPLEQLKDLQQALVTAQNSMRQFGGSPDDFLLMGHSAGAHLVALLSSTQAEVIKKGGNSWLGSILLDSAALNVPEIMRSKHYGFYDKAFGSNPEFWLQVSPYHQIKSDLNSVLLICSNGRSKACEQADRYAEKARSYGVSASVLKSPYSHKDINVQLGLVNDYTGRVEQFMSSLGVQVQIVLMQVKTDAGNSSGTRVGPIRHLIQRINDKSAD